MMNGIIELLTVPMKLMTEYVVFYSDNKKEAWIMNNRILAKIALSLVVALLIVVPLFNSLFRHRVEKYQDARRSLQVTVSSPFQNDTYPVYANRNEKPEGKAVSHTIIINNIHDPQQLQEILKMLEDYSRANQISDLNIKCFKEKENK
jgi:hypothetical protein